MSWTPAQQVINLAPVIDNIFQYLEENQEDALEWAGSSSTPIVALNPFEKFFTSAIGRVNTVYPSLSLLTSALETKVEGETVLTTYSMVFEGVIAGGDTNDITRSAMLYGMAVESMLSNITSDELIENTNIISAVIIAPLSTEYLILASIASAYYQVFRTKVTYQLYTGFYEE